MGDVCLIFLDLKENCKIAENAFAWIWLKLGWKEFAAGISLQFFISKIDVPIEVFIFDMSNLSFLHLKSVYDIVWSPEHSSHAIVGIEGIEVLRVWICCLQPSKLLAFGCLLFWLICPYQSGYVGLLWRSHNSGPAPCRKIHSHSHFRLKFTA